MCFIEKVKAKEAEQKAQVEKVNRTLKERRIMMKCPKCGSKNIFVKYFNFMGGEFLKKKCHNCDYSWEEPTEDSKLKNSKKWKIWE